MSNRSWCSATLLLCAALAAPAADAKDPEPAPRVRFPTAGFSVERPPSRWPNWEALSDGYVLGAWLTRKPTLNAPPPPRLTVEVQPNRGTGQFVKQALQAGYRKQALPSGLLLDGAPATLLVVGPKGQEPKRLLVCERGALVYAVVFKGSLDKPAMAAWKRFREGWKWEPQRADPSLHLSVRKRPHRLCAKGPSAPLPKILRPYPAAQNPRGQSQFVIYDYRGKTIQAAFHLLVRSVQGTKERPIPALSVTKARLSEGLKAKTGHTVTWRPGAAAPKRTLVSDYTPGPVPNATTVPWGGVFGLARPSHTLSVRLDMTITTADPKARARYVALAKQIVDSLRFDP